MWEDATWSVRSGDLRKRPGRPSFDQPLFRTIAERIPFAALDAVRREMTSYDVPLTGAYIAHDSMGAPRYIGRGNLFSRLRRRRSRQKLELAYFSFYVVSEKVHGREIETLLIRAAGPQLHFNTQKKRVDIQPGSTRDYEVGTIFFERRYRRGQQPKKTRQ